MYQDVIIAGFGGQGVLLIGNLLAYAAMDQGLNVTYIPVYGAEMRGGTANCTVVISDEEIGSPIIHRPIGLIAMNRPSLDKFQARLKDGGVMIVNSSLIDPGLAEKTRIKTFMVPMNQIADSMGNPRLVNMVAIGAFIQASGAMPVETVVKSLGQVISPHYKHMIPQNAEAIEAGAKAARG
ncbi:MAG: 2-oxoacid:acceptor oxidoreductase family protein [Desulfovibrionaceae bacterium]|nr:2-oxoacid:acceptor oxidoreductase family protein [Desulfovibrionaceae bacterium]MBF0512472.1 2-oxoacid:acceptor oxidoreductase family protein [Desulfovibrionaceae bacterium]